MSEFSLLHCLYRIIVSPIEMMFDMIFSIAFGSIRSVWIAIFILSIAVNVFTLPLYAMAEKKQRSVRELDKKSAPWIAHIRKTFRGDERTMRQQAYLKECGKNPFDSLLGIIPLLLQIPFFIAAYNFLSRLTLLEKAGFLWISDLSRADGLMCIGFLSVNILPLLMTLINIISSLIYTRDAGLEEKAQLILVALVFLILLYGSPSGVVLYWTMNNVFSLFKNIAYLIKDKYFPHIKKKQMDDTDRNTIFLDRSVMRCYTAMVVFMAVLCGLLIPTMLVASSPLGFIDRVNVINPVMHVFNTFLIAGGAFILWGMVVFLLATPKVRRISFVVILIGIILGLYDYFAYGRRPGALSENLVYSEQHLFSDDELLFNTQACLILIAIMLILVVLVKKKQERIHINKIIGILTNLFISAVAAIMIISGINILKIKKEYDHFIKMSDDFSLQSVSVDAADNIVLSKNEENVILIMLDRQIGAYVPYMLQEKPELKEIFDGFTYFPNTVSTGDHTLYGAPGLLGGYEYTTENINKRDDVLLKEKHNEALLMMPLMFLKQGYDVYVYDMPYADYKDIPDMSIYKQYPEIHAGYISKNDPLGKSSSEKNGADNGKVIFAYSFSKLLPVLLQEPFYGGGSYMLTERRFPYSGARAEKYLEDLGRLPEMNPLSDTEAVKCYNQLSNVKDMLSVSDNVSPAYVVFDNELSHNTADIKEPEYIPEDLPDNRLYDELYADRFTLANGESLENGRLAYYQVNMMTLLSVGRILERMKELGVYDNTRIIIVSDHGYHVGDSEKMIFSYAEGEYDTEYSYPILMVKAAGDRGFSTDESFMTNADVPVIAMSGIVEDMTNPFTGNPVTDKEKYEKPVLVLDCKTIDPDPKAYTFDEGRWFSVEGDRRDMSNWKYLGEW